MKFLVVLALVVLAAQAAQIPKMRDLSKYKPRSVLFPWSTEPKLISDGFVPHKPSPKNKMAETCGVPNVPVNKDSRVVGGQETTAHQYPWQVAVFIDDTYFCGGSLIGNQWVLTAAHCAADASFFNVVLGAHNIRLAEATQIEIVAFDYVVHPDWKPLRILNDIALIQLSEPVTYSDVISPICLPGIGTEFIDYTGKQLLVSGWGLISDNSAGISPTVQAANLTGISTQTCQEDFSNVSDNNVCCSTTEGKASCNGDSGGPLSDADSNNIFTQVGIVSFGSSAGCAEGYADVYTRVSAYRDFIRNTTGI